MPSRTKKMRGSRTHGRGAKAGRGAGLTGGRGMAGLAKTGKMRMLKYFVDMDDKWVPNNSLIREFIGDSCYQDV